jgi:hypothetical protein
VFAQGVVLDELADDVPGLLAGGCRHDPMLY